MSSGIKRRKKIITAYVIPHMTADEVKTRGMYIENGEERNEIWIGSSPFESVCRDGEFFPLA